MTKKKNIWIWIIVLVKPAILIYIVSPPHNLTIEINASPQGVQEFYIITLSDKFGLIHAAGSTHVDKRLVSVNQKIKIPLDRSKMNWLNPIYVKLCHPEYFWDIKETNNRYLSPKAQFPLLRGQML